eukprot:TRINITY_DN1411_c0_g1_i1.p2 TRINITY_DN1411_c0_g1~~TRINITY_DN1411_c0_g1_i1.p2  ORF type:complete len:120 (-),score=25.00 TRINITY_DN1411_c0_g1_i1:100-459(-)
MITAENADHQEKDKPYEHKEEKSPIDDHAAFLYLQRHQYIELVDHESEYKDTLEKLAITRNKSLALEERTAALQKQVEELEQQASRAKLIPLNTVMESVHDTDDWFPTIKCKPGSCNLM